MEFKPVNSSVRGSQYLSPREVYYRLSHFYRKYKWHCREASTLTDSIMRGDHRARYNMTAALEALRAAEYKLANDCKQKLDNLYRIYSEIYKINMPNGWKPERK